MGRPNRPIGMRRISFRRDNPLSKSSTSKAKTSADYTFATSGRSTGYTRTPTMTVPVNPPVPQAGFQSMGSKAKSARSKNVPTRTGTKATAKRLAKRWCSDAAATITYLATSPVMWHLVSPAYIDLVMKAGAKYKAKYTQHFCPLGREHPDRVSKCD